MARVGSAPTGATSASRSVRLIVGSCGYARLCAGKRRLGGLLLDRGVFAGQMLADLDGEVAGGDMLVRIAAARDQLRLRGDTVVLRLGAARVEPAAGRRPDRRRDVAGEHDPFPL